MVLWTLVSSRLNRFTRDEILHDLGTRPEVVVIDKEPMRASPYQFVMSDRRILLALEPYRIVVENQSFVALEFRSVPSKSLQHMNGQSLLPEQ
jgi:hypothetical protein